MSEPHSSSLIATVLYQKGLTWRRTHLPCCFPVSWNLTIQEVQNQSILRFQWCHSYLECLVKASIKVVQYVYIRKPLAFWHSFFFFILEHTFARITEGSVQSSLLFLFLSISFLCPSSLLCHILFVLMAVCPICRDFVFNSHRLLINDKLSVGRNVAVGEGGLWCKWSGWLSGRLSPLVAQDRWYTSELRRTNINTIHEKCILKVV